MPSRRSFLAGLATCSLLPKPTWANVGAPDFLSAARRPDGSYVLAGLTTSGDITFTIPLPGRGHAGAAHPDRPFAVVFARRPGRFAIVLDCSTGKELARFEAPEARHFYGHGVFSSDGRTLFTTENDFEAGQGVIGVWNAENNFARLGEFSSGGVGPHDITLMPDGETLVVANGGIETHPDSGRAKLNLPTMQSNLCYIGVTGNVLDRVELSDALRKNSIRHLAVRPDGLVAFAMQWQGDASVHPSLLGMHHLGRVRLLTAGEQDQRRLRGYAGSVALSNNGEQVAISSPRGNVTQIFDVETAELAASFDAKDICGLSTSDVGFFYTTGVGTMGLLSTNRRRDTTRPALSWDNHLIPVRRSS